MIPQKLHRIWFGPDTIPDDYQAWWHAWQRQFPDYEFVSWGDDDVRQLATYGQIERADSPARKADIARYEILYRFGGIYLDCDMMPFHHFDVQRYGSDLICCGAQPGVFSPIGFIAAAAGNADLKRAVDAILAMADINQEHPHLQTGPHFFGKFLEDGRFVNLPEEYFYPYGFDLPFSSLWDKNLANTFGIHVWAGSWASDVQKILKSVQKLLHGDAVEPERLLQFFPDCGTKAEIVAFVRDMRQLRLAEIALAKNPLLGTQRAAVDIRWFDLFKAGGFLLREEPDSLIWQIGAGDGLQPSHLRPLMINFDPPALLVESDPRRFEALRKNYARNALAICLNDIPIEVEALLAQNGGVTPKILVIENGESACSLTGSLLLRGVRPKIVSIQAEELSNPNKAAIEALLVDDYEILLDGTRLAAFRKDFFTRYCEHMFVDYGIPNIFRNALRVINGL